MPAPDTRPAQDTAAEDHADRPIVRLLPRRHKRVRAGHPWVYSNEIAMTPETRALPPGGIVTLVDDGGVAVGTATFNSHPLISARLISRDAERTIDADFLARRLGRALALRERLFDAPYYRLAWSEADGLPGLIADRFGDTVVVQANTAGMDRLLPELLTALDEVVAPACVVVRNDSPARALEGLAAETAVVRGALDGPMEVVENGVAFLADPVGGQKTGWFFDHRENRARVARLAAGRSVLDLYAYLGGFGLQAMAAGAAELVCVDRSQPALDLAARAAARNGVAGRCTFVRAEAYAEMARLAADGRRFEIVVADPPAFVKSKKDLSAGLKGYRKMVRMAAVLVAPGGLLFAASCSHHVDAASFAEQVRGGMRDARRSGRILHSGGAGPDHPVHPYLPESAYLKAVLLQLD